MHYWGYLIVRYPSQVKPSGELARLGYLYPKAQEKQLFDLFSRGFINKTILVAAYIIHPYIYVYRKNKT